MNQNIVIIPTYNEIENISSIIDKVFYLYDDLDILVVDDSSPDGTGELVSQKQHEYPNRLFLLERESKSGLGTAYIAGFSWALANSYQYIVQMDADFSHNPAHIQRLLDQAYSGYDVVVGSRYIDQGKIIDWPLDRRILSYGGSVYARFLTGIPVKDLTSGFVCYQRKTLEQLDLSKISSIGYSFQIEMKYAAFKLKRSITEVPITFKDRELGDSKMNSSIIKEAALAVVRMRLQEKDFYRLQPISTPV